MSHDSRRRYAITVAAFALTSVSPLPPRDSASGNAVGSVVTTSAMSAVRAAHTATTLRDGRVLVTGGYGGGRGPRASAWMYRP